MPDYKQGKIHTIRCQTDDTPIYVGWTTEFLSRRMTKHKYDSIKKPTVCFYNYVKDWNDSYIELYENFPCENKEQLNKREGEVIREIGTINKQIAGRTKKKWYEDNKEKIQENNQKYRETNKDKLKAYEEKRKKTRKEYKKEYYQRKKQEAKNTPKQIT